MERLALKIREMLEELNRVDVPGGGSLKSTASKVLEVIEAQKVNWDEVEKDTPVLVKSDVFNGWIPRHFKRKATEYENGIIVTYSDGRTSFSVRGKTSEEVWQYAMLPIN